jgi:hypothetical protein
VSNQETDQSGDKKPFAGAKQQQVTEPRTEQPEKNSPAIFRLPRAGADSYTQKRTRCQDFGNGNSGGYIGQFECDQRCAGDERQPG